MAGGASIRREHLSARHGLRQQGGHGEAQPRHGGQHRRQRRGQHPQEEKYTWNSECRELGNSAAHGRHSCKIPQDIQISRPCVVLPPRGLPADRLRRGSVWLGHRYSSGESVQGDHLLASQEHWDHRVCSRYSPDLRAVPEAEEGPQVPPLLERVPPLCRVHHHHPGHREHLQGHEHPGGGAEVEDWVHRGDRRPGRRGGGPGGHHLEHRPQEEEDGGQGLQRRWRRLEWPAALHVILWSGGRFVRDLIWCVRG